MSIIRQSSFHLLLWGCIIFAVSIGHFILLKFTHIEHPEYAWALTLPGMVISMLYRAISVKNNKNKAVWDGLYRLVWLAFIISLFILLV